MKITVTGDTHGEYGRLAEIIRVMSKYDDSEKYLIVAGDFGYLFMDDFAENKILNEIQQQDFTVIVIPGNHENYKAFSQYKTVDFHGAKAHMVRENVFYIRRGEIFTLGGKNFFCMGGGYSVDRYMRRRDVSYWEEEMPTDDEYKYAVENLANFRKDGKKIDYIISHTAPESGLLYLSKRHGIEELPLNNFLEYIGQLLRDEYKTHFFGHLHIDKDIAILKQRALWFDYVEINLDGGEDKTVELD